MLGVMVLVHYLLLFLSNLCFIVSNVKSADATFQSTLESKSSLQIGWCMLLLCTEGDTSNLFLPFAYLPAGCSDCSIHTKN